MGEFDVVDGEGWEPCCTRMPIEWLGTLAGSDPGLWLDARRSRMDFVYEGKG